MEHEPSWIRVPGGTLMRGTSRADVDEVVRRHSDLDVNPSWFEKEAPQAEVAVDQFFISETPITCAQWNRFAHDADLTPSAATDPDFPVDHVPWYQAQAYCEWLSERIGGTVELPTETQWERAARGDDAREYPWGNVWDRRAANTAELGIGTYLPVGTLLRGASPFGVLDMAGNVDEWTRDVYAPYPDAPDRVPAHETWAADVHVTRGGGYRHHRDLARCARRHGLYDADRGAGLRIVRES